MADPASRHPADPTDPADPADAAEQAIHRAQQAVNDLHAQAQTAGGGGPAATPSSGQASPFPLQDLGGGGPSGASTAGLSLLRDVNLHVKVELGRTRMYVEDVLRLNENSIIELDKLAGDPVDIYVNDRPVARGEVLVVNDNFCVRVSEIIQPIGDD